MPDHSLIKALSTQEWRVVINRLKDIPKPHDGTWGFYGPLAFCYGQEKAIDILQKKPKEAQYGTPEVALMEYREDVSVDGLNRAYQDLQSAWRDIMGDETHWVLVSKEDPHWVAEVLEDTFFSQ